MEEVPSTKTSGLTLCDACFAHINEGDFYCNSCGYPIKGSKFEQNSFLAKRNDAEIDLIAFKKKIKKAGNTLFYLSIFFIFCAIIGFFSNKDQPEVLAVVVPFIVLGVLFLVLGDYSKTKPLACMICGLCLFIIAQLLDFVYDPGSINWGSGVIIFIVLGSLGKGIKSAIDIERIKKEHNIA